MYNTGPKYVPSQAERSSSSTGPRPPELLGQVTSTLSVFPSVKWGNSLPPGHSEAMRYRDLHD